MLLWTLGCMYLFELVFLYFLDICPGVKLLGHIVVLFLVYEKPPCCFPQWLHQFTFPPTVYKGWSIFFWTWFLSLNIMFVRFIHILFYAAEFHSFSLLYKVPLHEYYTIYPVYYWWTFVFFFFQFLAIHFFVLLEIHIRICHVTRSGVARS